MTDQEELIKRIRQPLTSKTLRRVFFLFTRLLFSDANNYGGLQEMLENFVYSDDVSKRTLDVELAGVLLPANVNERPAVIVGFQPFQFQKVAVDNFTGASEDNSQFWFSKPCDAVLKIQHIAKTADEAYLLADVTTGFYFGMRTLLMQKLALRSFEVEQITGPTNVIKDQPDKQQEVSLICKLNFSYDMTVNLESLPIKKIIYEMLAQSSVS